MILSWSASKTDFREKESYLVGSVVLQFSFAYPTLFDSTWHHFKSCKEQSQTGRAPASHYIPLHTFRQSFKFRMEFQNLPDPLVEDGARSAVNFTNMLRAVFSPTSFLQKITNTNGKYRKAAKTLLYEEAAHKILVKLTPGEKIC